MTTENQPVETSPDSGASNLATLAAKGDGRLFRRGLVWTYPSCPLDASGSNLKLPVEFATDAAVQAALEAGTLVLSMRGMSGTAEGVRLPTDDAPAAISVVEIGSAHAATDRPSYVAPERNAGVH